MRDTATMTNQPFESALDITPQRYAHCVDGEHRVRATQMKLWQYTDFLHRERFTDGRQPQMRASRSISTIEEFLSLKIRTNCNMRCCLTFVRAVQNKRNPI